MEITYKITEDMQKEQAANGLDASKKQTCVLTDKETGLIITGNPHVTITAEGHALLNLTGQLLHHTKYKNIWAGRDGIAAGPATGNVSRKSYSVDINPGYTTGDMYHSFSYTINDVETLQKALNEIDMLNVKQKKDAEKRTAEQLLTFQSRIDEYNKQFADKQADREHEAYIAAEIEIKKLKETISKLREQLAQAPVTIEIGKIRADLLEEIIEDGCFGRDEEVEVQYTVEQKED